MSATFEQNGTAATNGPAATGRAARVSAGRPRPVLIPWLRAQAVNVMRHAAALRPFKRGEFGTGAASPSEGHMQAVNRLIEELRADLIRKSGKAGEAVRAARRDPSTRNLQRVVTYKEKAHNWVRAVEQIWDFYFELFGQRQSRFADWLLSCDRIALDTYQDLYMGVAIPKSIPAPPPFSYMRTGFSPATFRRGIPLRRLGRRLNPFPLIQLPYHRLVNPWTLGAILHEVSHNTQNELGLAEIIPRSIGRRLLRAGIPREVAAIWVRWNREIFADMSGLLLGGPGVVSSLMDVIGRSPRTVFTYLPRGPHPTPYLRAFLSTELLRRMGFPEKAAAVNRAWRRCYPNPRAGNIPRAMIDTFEEAHKLVIDQICFRPYQTLGGKSLSQVTMFGPKEQVMTEEAARRLAAGNDPGIIPERFLIGASRIAFDRKYARPEVIQQNFYKELARR